MTLIETEWMVVAIGVALLGLYNAWLYGRRERELTDELEYQKRLADTYLKRARDILDAWNLRT